MVNIRKERPGDQAAVRAVNEAAFDTPAEAALVDRLRSDATPVVSLVAQDYGRGIVGHILFTPVTLPGHPKLQLMGLAPMAVLPAYQRQRVGSALVETGLVACGRLEAGAVVVLGHPAYYPRFGFRRADAFGLACEYDAPPEAFMAFELKPGYLAHVSGVVHFHPAFRDL